MAGAVKYNPESVSDACTCGIRHIGIGTISSGKLCLYLKKNGFNDDVIREACDELIRRRYIDDDKAGRKVLLYRSGKKQESKRYLRERLYAAGVSSQVADDLISMVEDDSDLCFNLYLSVKPEVGSIDEAHDMSDYLKKLAQKRGFTPDISVYAYDKWLEKVLNDQ